MLTTKQRSKLKSLANTLKPAVIIGKGELTECHRGNRPCAVPQRTCKGIVAEKLRKFRQKHVHRSV